MTVDNINKKKKIAIVLPDLSVIGGQRYAIKVAENFIAIGYNVHILVFYKKGGFLRETLINDIFSFTPVIFKKIRAINVIESLFYLCKKLRREKYDIVLSITPFFNRALCLFKSLKLIKGKLIIEEHAYPPASFKDEFGFFARLLYKFSEFLYNYSDFLRVQTRDAYEYYCGILRSKKKVKFFPSLHDLSIMEKLGFEKSNLILRKAKYNMVYLGRFTSQKNISFLIEIFDDIVKKIDCHLWIIGFGPEKENLIALVNKSGLSEKITFLNNQENNFCLLRQGDVFPFTSIWEGLPRVLIEAMLFKVPVVSFDCKTGPKDIIGANSERGWLVKEGDKKEFINAIIEALTNKEKAKNKAELAYKFIWDQYDINKRFDEYVSDFIES